MSTETKSEALFEVFLKGHGLAFERIPEAEARRPDYWVMVDRVQLVFEVKELTEDDDFKLSRNAVSSRNVGDHIRAKIRQAREQIQFGARQGIPSILLIYNALDPMQRFGTEPHDFRAAMYGDWTLAINRETRAVDDAYHGRNASFRERHNTSFGAIGLLKGSKDNLHVTLHENLHSSVPVPFVALPPCFWVVRYGRDGGMR